MRLIFMGTPEFAVPVLEGLCAIPSIEVVGVATTPDRPAGRGRHTEASPVKAYAAQHGLNVLQPASLRPAAAQGELAALAPEVIVVAAYGLLLPPAVLALPALGCLNLHPSLLPRHRGPSPVATAIAGGDQVTGVTLMLLDQGMDTGPLIAQSLYPLTGNESAETLTEDLFRLGTDLLAKSIGPWAGGALKAVPQDGDFATVTRKLERVDGLADWDLSATVLERRRRAFTPWPGLYTQWEGKGLKLLDVAVLPESAGGSTDLLSGTVTDMGVPDMPVAVATADGMLGLKTVQLEGRRAVSAAEFLRGFPGIIGAHLG